MTSVRTRFQNSEQYAKSLDDGDELSKFRQRFFLPVASNGKSAIYMAGHSLGLQPINARKYVEDEFQDWASMGVEGHFAARHPWVPYHQNVTDMTARLVGAMPSEVVAMNGLTVNLHLMMVSFYRPTKERFKILIESNAFPSDLYAVQSQAEFHHFDPTLAVGEFKPHSGELILKTQEMISTIEKEGSSLALVLLGNVNYLTGQAFDIPAIVEAAHKVGAKVGLNLAHGAGNLVLKLHDWNVDFAVWCSYKYLNAGPGGIAGAFIHERYGKSFDLPRFTGWWGHNQNTRFLMPAKLDLLNGAEGWQLSNPPIFQLAALRASLEIFDEATMPSLRKKGDLLTSYLEFLLDELPYVNIVTPRHINERGSQLSFQVKGNPLQLWQQLKENGAISDFREPDILRCTPVPLYNSFHDVWCFGQLLRKYANQ